MAEGLKDGRTNFLSSGGQVRLHAASRLGLRPKDLPYRTRRALVPPNPSSRLDLDGRIAPAQAAHPTPL